MSNRKKSTVARAKQTLRNKRYTKQYYKAKDFLLGMTNPHRKAN